MIGLQETSLSQLFQLNSEISECWEQLKATYACLLHISEAKLHQLFHLIEEVRWYDYFMWYMYNTGGICFTKI